MTIFRVMESCLHSPERGDSVKDCSTRPEAQAYIDKNEEASLDGGFCLYIMEVSDK